MNTELTKTARVIASIGVKAYRDRLGLPASPADVEQQLIDMSKAQIIAYNAIAEWHNDRMYDGDKEA